MNAATFGNAINWGCACPRCPKTFSNVGNLSSHLKWCGTDKHLEWFWSRVTKGDGCWIYKGHKLNTGHCMLTRHRVKLLAHRYSWTLAHGAIPDGMMVLHHCDVPACVRPEHLYLGSHAENHADMIARGRTTHGEKSSSAKLTDAKVLEILALKGKESEETVGPRYGVQPRHIYQIWRGAYWKHLQARRR